MQKTEKKMAPAKRSSLTGAKPSVEGQVPNKTYPSIESPAIVVRKCGDGFSVDVEPQILGRNYSGSFDSAKAARSFAGGLRFTLGLPLLIEEAAR